MIRAQIQFDEDQYRRLKELASRKQVSVASIVRQAVNRALRTKKPGRASLYKEALKVAGKYRTKEVDISTEHDKYLEEDFQ